MLLKELHSMEEKEMGLTVVEFKRVVNAIQKGERQSTFNHFHR